MVRVADDKAPAVVLKLGSIALGNGINTGFTNGDETAIAGYYKESAWETLSGSNPERYLVTTNQNGISRPSSPSIGASESTAENVFMLKVNAASGGDVKGGIAGTNLILYAQWTKILSSIEITSPATKVSYKVGESLDIKDLVVSGTVTLQVRVATTATYLAEVAVIIQRMLEKANLI